MHKIEDSFQIKNQQSGKNQTTNKQSTCKKSNKDKIIINIADTQYAVVKSVAKKLKWNLIAQPLSNMNFDLCWTDNHVRQQIFARMQEHQKINHFPGMTVLSRKNNLGKNLTKFRKQFPDQYDFFPLTWSLPYDYPDLKEYHDNRKQGKAQTFIVKPQASCQGRGIFLTRNIDKLKYQKCVVQRYMHKPFLIDGLKFDLRIYVLVAGIDPLRIYVYQDGLARFATQQYCPPRSDNLQNHFMHLTNYAINKHHPDFIFNQTYQQSNVGHKRSLKSIYQLLQKQGHDVDQLKQKINQIFIKTLITGYPVLSRTMYQVHPDNFANDMCFQILGFDIMLDHKLNPYILEVNYTPSFTADTPLDKHIKKNLILDTLSIVNLNSQWKYQLRKKRQKDLQQRMMTGKRKKYTTQQRKKLFQQALRKRNQHQKNCPALISGRFTKIFMKKDMVGLGQYHKFYEFAQQIYSQQNNATGSISSNAFPLYKMYSDLGSEKNNISEIKENLEKNHQKMRSSYQNNQSSNQKTKSYMNSSNFIETDKQKSGTRKSLSRNGCQSVQGRKAMSAKGKNRQKPLILGKKPNLQIQIQRMPKKQQSPLHNIKKSKIPKPKKLKQFEQSQKNESNYFNKDDCNSDSVNQNYLENTEYENIVFNHPDLRSALSKKKSEGDLSKPYRRARQ